MAYTTYIPPNVGQFPAGVPHAGQGPFGLVPGPLGDVSEIAYNDLLKRLPNLPGLNRQASSGISSHLAGQLSPETLAQIQDIGARFGYASGMPGAGLAQYRTARDLGRTTEDLQRAGLQDYGNLLSTVKGTQNVSPETQIGSREQDLLNAAAPDPTQSASHAEELFNRYLNSIGRGGGYRGPQGGTGDYQSPSSSGRAAAAVPATAAGGGSSGYDPFNELFNSPDWDFGMGGWTPNNPSDTSWYDPLASNASQWASLFPGEEPYSESAPAPSYGEPLVSGQQYGPWDQDWWNF